MTGGPARRDGSGRKPAWLRVRAPAPRQYRATGAVIDDLRLHTVCQEARCPNKGECFAAGTATFLILGATCTRACRFCAVERGGEVEAREEAGRREAVVTGVCAVDPDEPRRVAAAASRLGLRHVVITSVTRDDLPDGGATQFAAAVAAVRAALPATTVEVLIPDLGGDDQALGALFAARPDVLNHNLETVARLYPVVRPQAEYARSLRLLSRAAGWARGPASGDAAAEGEGGVSRERRPLVKTGLMVGLGERDDEIATTLADCAAAGVDAVTVGQYLQPDTACLPVRRYVSPEEFAAYERRGAELGLAVRAAPFVRSSYRAGEFLAGDGP
jgi:lipoic acid synthetase